VADQGGVRWNPETQSWDSGGTQAPYTPPPPPRPDRAPGAEPAVGQPEFLVQPSWQPTVPEPQARPWYRRGVVVLSVAVVVLAAGVGSYLLWGRGEEPPVGAGPSASPSAADSPPAEEPTTEPTDSETSPSPSATPPPGYRLVTESEFSLVVPEDWKPRTEDGKNGVTLYYYEEPDGPRRLQVFRVTEANATPMSTLKLAERDLKRLPGYERNALGPVSDARGEAAELDYSYMSDEWAMELRTLDRIVPAAPDDPSLWAVLSIGPADGWPEQREVVEDVLESFTVSPGEL
jgi:hypothetical protein